MAQPPPNFDDMIKDKITAANAEAIRRLSNADVVLEDIVPAREVIPFLRDNEMALLHAGPPRDYSTMCEAMKGAMIGMVLIEEWATTVEEAKLLLSSGKIKFGSNNEHESVGPMSGIISPSLPVFVVANRSLKCEKGNDDDDDAEGSGCGSGGSGGDYYRCFSRPADLHQQFGNYEKIEAVKEWKDDVAETMRIGLKRLGGIRLAPLLQQAVEMGDELHNRVNALTMLLQSHLSVGMMQEMTSAAEKNKENDDEKKGEENNFAKRITRVMQYVYNNPNGVRLTLGLAMAAAKAQLKAIEEIEYCSIITCMCRNGVDWAIRVSATGKEWFIAPSPTCYKYYLFPPYSREDFGNDMGDSVITETMGWGGLIMPNSMALAYSVGATPEEAFEIAKTNQQVVIAKNPQLKIPAFGYDEAPLGIDVRKVVKIGAAPIINTGIAHREAGHSVVARGLLQPPLECFLKAVNAFCEKYSLSKDDLLSSC